MSVKTQEVTSNKAIIEKNKKLCQPTGIVGNQGTFSDKVTPDTDVFTDQPVVQCNFQVVENTFIDDSK